MTYPGGKSGSGVYQQIINLMPPHDVYIEAFLGGGAIMKIKRPATLANIGIDVDTAALQDFYRINSTIPNLELHPISALEYLAPGPSAKYISRPETLLYLDPPYLMSTRSTQRPIYKYEFSTEYQHAWLLDTARRLLCKVMISGYWSDLYAEKLSDWRSVSFQAQTRSGRPATEYVWMNFSPPLELHDYRFLGNDFRERERIKRKQDRWKKRLQTMPDLERHAILAAISSLRDPASS